MLQCDIADVFILISGWKPPSGATQEMQPDNYHSSLQLFIAIGHQQHITNLLSVDTNSKKTPQLFIFCEVHYS